MYLDISTDAHAPPKGKRNPMKPCRRSLAVFFVLAVLVAAPLSATSVPRSKSVPLPGLPRLVAAILRMLPTDILLWGPTIDPNGTPRVCIDGTCPDGTPEPEAVLPVVKLPVL